MGAVRYTLRGLYRDAEEAASKEEDLKNSGLETCQIELMSPKMNKLFAVLAKHDVSPTRRTGIPRSHTTDWEATRMCIEAFRRTVVAAGRAGDMTVWWLKDDRSSFEEGGLYHGENSDSDTTQALHR